MRKGKIRGDGATGEDLKKAGEKKKECAVIYSKSREVADKEGC